MTDDGKMQWDYEARCYRTYDGKVELRPVGSEWVWFAKEPSGEWRQVCVAEGMEELDRHD
jgi:hypothetical protein